MAESSWWQQPTDTTAGRPLAAVPPPPSSPPAPQTIGVRTLDEVRRLAADAARPTRVTMFATLDEVAVEGISATVRWLLGERSTSPISREVDDYPRDDRSTGREAARADDVIWGRGPYAEVHHEDYAGAVRATLRWIRTAEEKRPLAEQ
jgi:hypothetical protein